MIRIGSLFTGIGGLDFGHVPEWFCERDPFARRVLAARFPGVPIYDDVTTLTGPEPIDVLTGGFPCQDVSVAGKQAGIEGEKTGLWRHMLRLTDELRPRVVIAENVANIQRSMAEIVREYEAIGYRMEATRIAASDLGAPHERMRLLILAWREDVPVPWPIDEYGGTWARLRPRAVMVPRWRTGGAPTWTTLTAGDTGRTTKYAQGGNPLSSQVRDWPTATARDGSGDGPKVLDGRRGELLSQSVRESSVTARDRKSSSTGTQGNSRPLSECVVGPLNPDWCEILMGLPPSWTDPRGVPGEWPGWPMGRGPEQHPWEPPRMVAPRSVPHRADRIRCLGNAVVPAVGAVAWRRVLSAL